VGLLTQFYPWQNETIAKATAADLLYEAARNPLAHSLGLEAPAPAGHVQREIALAKRPLTQAEIMELENEVGRPASAGPTVTVGRVPSGADRFVISVGTLYWGMHRMLRALFADTGQVAAADAVAKKFGPMWDRYVSVSDAIEPSDSEGVRVRIGREAEARPEKDE